MNKNNAFRRGFTLIELMIVIVILGILMGTILPRLTGAQSRARDTARIADLNNISQALEVYSSDFGQYPNAACTSTGAVKCDGKTTDEANCLSANADPAVPTNTYNLLKTYMKGSRVPQNIGIQTNTLGCVGSYYYSPLTKGGSANQSYVLASNLETWQMANFDSTPGKGIPASDTAFLPTNDASKYIPNVGKLAADPALATSALYIVIP